MTSSFLVFKGVLILLVVRRKRMHACGMRHAMLAHTHTTFHSHTHLGNCIGVGLSNGLSFVKNLDSSVILPILHMRKCSVSES